MDPHIKDVIVLEYQFYSLLPAAVDLYLLKPSEPSHAVV